MAGKRKQRRKKSQASTTVPAQPAAQPQPRRAPRRRRRLRQSSNGQRTGRRELTPWFMVYTRKVTMSPQTPVILFNKILHPSSFPNTPYFNGNADFAFRVEHRVEFDIIVTSGTLVGSRFAVALDRTLSNPRIADRQLLLNLVLNGLGAMVSAAGPTERRTTFSVSGPTSQLSNSPPPTLDLVGFSQGRVLVGMIDPPTLGEDVQVSVDVTVSMRVDFTPMVPSPQTLTGLILPFPPGPEPGPGPGPHPDPDPDLVVTWSQAQQLPPAVHHTGDIYLASGAFWRCDAAADKMADTGGHPVSPQAWADGRRPQPNCVYQLVEPAGMPIWPFATAGYNAWGGPGAIPRYFTCYSSGAGGWTGLVGFADLYYAVLQATYPTTVSGGEELQLGDYWGTTGVSGQSPSVSVAFSGQRAVLRLVWSPAQGGPIGLTSLAGGSPLISPPRRAPLQTLYSTSPMLSLTDQQLSELALQLSRVDLQDYYRSSRPFAE